MSRSLLVKVIAATVLSVFSIGTWVTSGKLNVTWLQYFSVAVFAATALLAAWDLLLWRLPPFQKVPGTPKNLRGTWKGEVISLWQDPNSGDQVPPVEAYLVVRQTSTTVSATLLTSESTSASTLSRVSTTDGAVFLHYLYLNRPRTSVRHRSAMHHGSAVLDAAGSPAHRLTGRYWTDRDSKGELRFDELSKRIADDVADAAELFQPPSDSGRANP